MSSDDRSPAERKWARRLKGVGVTLEDATRLIMRCDECGQGWSPNIQPGGGLHRGYWHCPQGCNREKRLH